MRYFLFFILIFNSGVAISSVSDLERVELANYLRELNKIDHVYMKAKKTASKSEGDYKFLYSEFERDLNKVKNGIEAYLNAPVREPRVLSEKVYPVSGEYQ